MDETTFTQLVSELGTLTMTFLEADDEKTAGRLLHIHKQLATSDPDKLVASFDALSTNARGAVADFCPTPSRWIADLRNVTERDR